MVPPQKSALSAAPGRSRAAAAATQDSSAIAGGGAEARPLRRHASSAASASESAKTIPRAASSARGTSPTKWTTHGLRVAASASTTRCATSAAGGFETTTITFVSGSAASASMPSSIISPPTSAERSRPPVPMACETPPPRRWMTLETSWMPVPAAPTMPIGPRRTALAKASGRPPRMAVPQSGPISSNPRPAASCLSATSSASDTLSEKSITCRPSASARRASRAACSPGTEMSTRFAAGWDATAAASDDGRASSPAPACDCAFSSRSSSASTAAGESAAPFTAMSRSLGVALASSAPP